MENNRHGIEDGLYIGYDKSNDKDHTSLMIGRMIGRGTYMLINEFFDEEAEEIYNKLIGKDKK